MRTLGIDLATEPAKTAACGITWTAGGARVDLLATELGDDDLVALCDAGFAKIGIDCPVGWPDGFVSAIALHHRGESWPGRGRDDQRAFRAELVLRQTDHHVRARVGILPLSVSTDRIGVTAMRLATLLDRLALAGRAVDRSGEGLVAEVYPAAALRQWGLPSRGYKGRDGATIRGEIVAELSRRAPWLDLATYREQLHASDHCLDGLISSLVARGAATARTDPPPSGDLAPVVAREGWIHVPDPGSLDTLDRP